MSTVDVQNVNYQILFAATSQQKVMHPEKQFCKQKSFEKCF